MMADTHDADVIVVGAGMLGGLAAERLAKAGKSVLILDAGPRVQRFRLLEGFRRAGDKTSSDAFYPQMAWAPTGDGGTFAENYYETSGAVPFRPATLRVVGGTTWHWSSAFWRYIPNDFRMRSVYGVGRDWPIDYAELEPWYTQVEQFTGAAGSADEDQGGGGGRPWPPRSAPYPLPPERWSSYTRAVAAKFNALGMGFIHEANLIATEPFKGRLACRGNNNCSPICPIGAIYGGEQAVAAAEKAGAKILPETVAYRLETGAGGKIVAVHTRAPDGTSTRRTARAFILAAHAVETPRLLMLSGLAGRSDQLGRNVMTHPSMVWQALVKDPVWPGRGPTQQGASVKWRDGPHRARHTAFKYHVNNTVPNLRITDRLLDMGVVGTELDERIRHDSARFVSMIAGMDQLPLPTNRITLGSRKDGLGLPTPHIHYDNDDYVRAGAEVVRREFAQFDAAFAVEVPLSDHKAQPRPASAHIMGTTIMGRDAGDSVVDKDCRVWGHANLYIASTSVFASASVVNPTLTGAALSLRLADRLARDV